MEVCLFCYPGTETIVREELQEKCSFSLTHDFPGAQYVKVDSIDDAIWMTYSLQTVTSLLLTAGKVIRVPNEKKGSDDTLRDLASTIDSSWFSFINPLLNVRDKLSFAVRMSTTATDKKQIERTYGGKVYDILSELFPQTEITVDLDTPNLLIQGREIAGMIHLGINWLQKPCGGRDYKVMNSYRSLPGPLASIPVRLFTNHSSPLIVTPIYTGDICIESALGLSGNSPHYFAQDSFEEKSSLYRLMQPIQNILDSVQTSAFFENNSFTVGGYDENPRHIAQAEKNILLSQVADNCELHQDPLHDSSIQVKGVIIDGDYVEPETCDIKIRGRLKRIESSLMEKGEVICVIRSHTADLKPVQKEGFLFKRKICAQYGDEFLHYWVYQKA